MITAGTFKLDIKEQTRAVIENIQAILKEGGADLSHVVDMTVFLVDMRDYKGVCVCCVMGSTRAHLCASTHVLSKPQSHI